VNGQDGGLVRRAAVRFLVRWAESSVVNCGKIAGMQGGPALARALTEAGTSAEDLALARSVTTCMSVLARDSPVRFGPLPSHEGAVRVQLFEFGALEPHRDCSLPSSADPPCVVPTSLQAGSVHPFGPAWQE